jgi:hypothetical protein
MWVVAIAGCWLDVRPPVAASPSSNFVELRDWPVAGCICALSAWACSRTSTQSSYSAFPRPSCIVTSQACETIGSAGACACAPLTVQTLAAPPRNTCKHILETRIIGHLTKRQLEVRFIYWNPLLVLNDFAGTKRWVPRFSPIPRGSSNLNTQVAITCGYGHLQLSKAVVFAELANFVLFHGEIFTDLTVR